MLAWVAAALLSVSPAGAVDDCGPKCTDTGGCKWCESDAAGSNVRFCSTMGSSTCPIGCTLVGSCPGQPGGGLEVVGRISLFSGAGSFSTTVRSIGEFTINEVREELAAIAGVSEGNLSARSGGFVVGSEDWVSSGGQLPGTNVGFAFAATLDGNGDAVVKACDFSGSTTTLRGTSTLESGDASFTNVTIGGTSYALVIHAEVLTSAEWNSIDASAQADFWADVNEEVATAGITPSAIVPTSACE